MKYTAIFICLLLSGSCTQKGKDTEEAYLREIRNWQRERIERLKSENGWLNLAGLYWLKEGVNTFGSDSSNTIVFPGKIPPFAGEFVKQNNSVRFIPKQGSEVHIDGHPASEMILQPDISGKPSVMEYNNLKWYLIERDSLLGIRLRDLDHPRVNKLKEIPSFETDPAWRKNASFIPFKEPDSIWVPTIIGVSELQIATGKLVFTHAKKEYMLIPFKSGENLFIIFGDQTSSIETYAAGRFLSTAPPDDNNKVILDFNKAYNPPCAFSPFATCPLPPQENRLDIRITAGEKTVHLD